MGDTGPPKVKLQPRLIYNWGFVFCCRAKWISVPKQSMHKSLTHSNTCWTREINSSFLTSWTEYDCVEIFPFVLDQIILLSRNFFPEKCFEIFSQSIIFWRGNYTTPESTPEDLFIQTPLSRSQCRCDDGCWNRGHTTSRQPGVQIASKTFCPTSVVTRCEEQGNHNMDRADSNI